MADLDITGRVVVDASQAEGAFDRVGDKAEQMAREVSGAAGKAGQAVDKIGDGAGASAEKFTRAEARISDAIKRTQTNLELLGKTASQKLEFKINEKGLDPAKFEPALVKLREIEAQSVRASVAANGSLNSMGMSAQATAAALRGVPAQFTDIVTSIQGGQAPLTVFLQQGGQLKDMFGGAGNAAKALGGYVLGLVNPFTLTAAAVGVLAYAYYKGSQEATAYNKAIILTGNAAGTTAIQLQTVARSISSITGTQGAAADALTQLAGSGKVSSENLEYFATVALKVEKTVGTAVAETVKQFAELGKAPVDASVKLNEQTNYLTVSIFKQIKALDDQGRSADAAALAQNAYADAMSSRSNELTQNLGSIERAWAGVKGAAKVAWDAMLNVGRSDSLGDQLSRARDELEARMARGPLNSQTGGSFDKGNERLRQTIALLSEQDRLLKRGADTQREQAEVTKAYIAFDKEGDEFKTKAAKREEAVTKAKIEGQRLIAAGLITEKDLRERIADINKKYEDKSAGGASARAQSEYDKLIASIKAKIALNKEEIAGDAKLNEADKLRIALTAALEQGAKKMTAAHIANAQAQLKELDASERAKEVYLAQKKFEQERDKEAQGIASDIAKIEAKAQALEDEAKAYGLTTEALQAIAIARLQENKAIVSGFDNSSERVAQIDAEIAALKRLGEAGSNLASVKLASNSEEVLRNAQAQAAIYSDETRQAGLTALERAKITAERKVEYEYAKKLADIDKSGATDAAKEAARIKVNEAKQIESTAAVNKVMQDEAQKTADSINQSLTDALLRGFESGKDFAKNLRDTVINMFKTMVLRPVISAVLSPVSMALGGLGGLAGAANAGQAAGGLGGLGTALSGIGALSSAFGTGMAASFTSMMSGGIGGWASAAGSLIGTGAAGGIAAGLGMIAAPLAAVALLWKPLFGRTLKDSGIQGTFGGTSGFEGESYKYYEGGLFRSDKTTHDPLDEAFRKMLGDTFNAMKTQVSDFADALGLTTERLKDYTSTIKISTQGLDEQGAQKKIQEALATANNDLAEQVIGSWKSTTEEITRQVNATFIEMENGAATTRSVTETQTVNQYTPSEFAKDGEKAIDTLTRLATSLTTVNSIWDTLGYDMLEASLAGGDAASKMADAFGGLEKLAAATASYYQNFYSDEERRATAQRQLASELGKVGVNIPDINSGNARDQYRALVEQAQKDDSDAGRKLLATLISLAPAFAELTQSAKDAAAALEAQRKAAIDTAYQALQNSVSAQRAQLDIQKSLAQESIDTLTKVFDLVSSNARDLYGSVATTAAQQAAQGNAYIDNALSAARSTGYAPDATALATAIQSARSGLDSGTYTTQFAKDTAALELAGKLSALGDITGEQLSTAERTLKAINEQIDQGDKLLAYWKQQIDIANGSYTALVSIGDAINAIDALLRPKDKKPDAAPGKGGGAVFGGGGGAAPAPADPAKYRTPVSLGTAGVGYIPVTDTAAISRLDSLASGYHAFDGTGDAAGLNQWIADNNVSAKDLSGLSGLYEQDWERWKNTYGLATGTNYVPRDMLAQIHEGEAVIPKAYNPWADGGGRQADTRVPELLTQLIDDNRTQAAEIVRINARVAKLLERWDGDGLPTERLETA